MKLAVWTLTILLVIITTISYKVVYRMQALKGDIIITQVHLDEIEKRVDILEKELYQVKQLIKYDTITITNNIN